MSFGTRLKLAARRLPEYLEVLGSVGPNYLDNNMAKDARIEKAFHEVYSKVPKTVKATGKTGEAKRKMMTAVALSKARAAGARIPKMHEGGEIPESGAYEMKKGERVIPAGQADAKVKIKIKVKGADALKALGAGGSSGSEVGKGGVPESRRSPVITEPSTQFPLHKLPAGMEIPANTEGASVPGAYSSTSAHPALASRSLEHFEGDGVGGSGTRCRTAEGVTSRPGHEATSERQAHVKSMRAKKEESFK